MKRVVRLERSGRPHIGSGRQGLRTPLLSPRALRQTISRHEATQRAPLAPGKMRKGGLKTSTVVGLYVALILLAVLLVPLTIALLGAIFPVDASTSVSAVAELVGTTILLPIALGVAVATVAPAFAGTASRIAGAAGMIGVLLLLALIAFVQRGAAAALIGDGTLFAIVVIISAGLLAGHLLGRPDPAYSNALAKAAAIRHPGIAVLIAQANFQDKRVVLAIILFLVVSVIVTTIYQKLTAREAAKPGSRAPAG